MELDYEESDDEISDATAEVACSDSGTDYVPFEAGMKMKYTGHRNARWSSKKVGFFIFIGVLVVGR